MSSTNRGYNRHETDFYVTPQVAVEAFLSEWLHDVEGEFNDDTIGLASRPDKIRWLDPCAGGDADHEMSYPAVIKKAFDPEVMATIDIRQDSRAEMKGDYRLEKCPGFDVIITNPPFYDALSIIEKALDDVNDGGYVVMLLRLNFFGSNGRFGFFQCHLPKWVYIHHRRFSFTDDGKTDSIEYMHAVWQKNADPEFSMLRVI